MLSILKSDPENMADYKYLKTTKKPPHKFII